MAALANVRDTSELGGKYIALPVKGRDHHLSGFHRGD